MNDSSDFIDLMQEGASLHRAGQAERALVCFERALALQPGNTNAASACATMLSSLVFNFTNLMSVSAITSAMKYQAISGRKTNSFQD